MFESSRNKELVSMRIWAIALIVMLMSAGCAHLDVDRKAEALTHIQAGDTQEDLVNIVGEPDIKHDIDDGRAMFFFQTQSKASEDDLLTTDLCTPVAIENGKVVSVGEDLTPKWSREKEARLRNEQARAQKRKKARLAELERKKIEDQRRQKIAELEKKVKPVPASNAELNLKLYKQLLELDPFNDRYQKRVALYEKRLAEQTKKQKARQLKKQKERRKQAWEDGRNSRNTKLRQYSGNGTAEMAAHDMGNGSLYVWVKNISNQIITTHPDHFTLVDENDHGIPCKISDHLDSVLEPGGISHGRIEYDESAYPQKLIFENREAGKIIKKFE